MYKITMAHNCKQDNQGSIFTMYFFKQTKERENIRLTDIVIKPMKR